MGTPLTARYLVEPTIEDLGERSMVFVSGPRQVGKTTLASQLVAAHFEHTVTLNWDNRADRTRMMAGAWPGGTALVILDELHKCRTWKRFLKGEYDRHRGRL